MKENVAKNRFCIKLFEETGKSSERKDIINLWFVKFFEEDLIGLFLLR